MQRALGESRRRGRLDDLARVHDRDAVRELEQQRQVVRDEEHREAEVALERLDLLQDLPLHDDVERGRRLVEDDELRIERERHCDDHALAHSARQLVRVCAHETLVHADEVEQLAGAHDRAVLRDVLVRLHHVDELVADPHDGIERVHRALEHHRHVAPAEAAQLLVALAGEVFALEADAAADDVRRRAQDLHDGVRDRALAATRLAREPEGLALDDLEVDTVDCAHVPVLHLQATHLEQRLRGDGAHAVALPKRSLTSRPRLCSVRSCGLLTSSMPASTSTRPSTVSPSARLGNRNGHHSPCSTVELTCAQ